MVPFSHLIGKRCGRSGCRPGKAGGASPSVPQVSLRSGVRRLALHSSRRGAYFLPGPRQHGRIVHPLKGFTPPSDTECELALRIQLCGLGLLSSSILFQMALGGASEPLGPELHSALEFWGHKVLHLNTTSPWVSRENPVEQTG